MVDTLGLEWWMQVRKRVAKVQRKGFDSLIWLVTWLLSDL